MSNWNANEIVKILVKDEALLQAKTRFARFLNIPGDSLREFEDNYNQQNDIHSYFCKVLEKWKSANGNEATISSLSNILRDNQFAASAESLATLPNCIPAPNLTASADRLSTPIHIPSSVTKLQVKEPVFNFVGRKKELFQLNELFKENKASVVLSSAMGGKGKTELCRRFIQQLPEDIDTLVTWISGDGLQQFHQSLSEICQEMKVQTTDPEGKPLSIEKIIENMSNKRKTKWAVIIDNVDELFSDFYKTIDAFLRNGAFVVVTSRKSDIDSEKHIFLNDLENGDAWEFVRSSLSINVVPCFELIEELCKCLQNYPLALQQAVAYIKYKQRGEDENYGIREYLLAFNSDNSQVLDHAIPLTGYEHTILRVFELTLSKIVNLNSLTLLNILSLVQPDGIEKEFLKKIFSLFEMEELFDSSIFTLKSFSLIGVNKGEVSVHRVVQKLARDRMKSKNNFNLVVNQILENIDADKLREKEIIQVVQVWKNALTESEIIKKNSNFAVKICNRLYKLYLDREMKEISEIILLKFFTFLEPNHIDILRMQVQVGKALKANGEFDEALVKYLEVWEKEKKVLGEEHEETLNCADEIATVLRRLERFEESLELHERVLKSRVKVHGDNQKNIMVTKNNIALVLEEQSKGEEAFTIWKQVLEWREKILGHEHAHTLTTRHNIAAYLHRQGKFEEAKKEFEEILELRLKIRGEDHAETLSTKYRLSLTLYSLGEKEKALKMIEEVLLINEKVLRPNHHDTFIKIRSDILKWRIERNSL